MNRIVFLAILLLLVFGCAPTTTPPAPKEATPDVAAQPEAPAPASTTLSMNYIDAASALAADDLGKAKASLAALAKESTGELKTLAQAASDTGDIAATRERFKPLSALAITMELPKDYAVAHCPMYKGGSDWVQKKEDKLANPYFGKGNAMLTCGSFK